jgi:hypothetical protein
VLGGDRVYLWRVAAGSAGEVRSALGASIALGDVAAEAAAPALGLIDQEKAMLYRLTTRQAP